MKRGNVGLAMSMVGKKLKTSLGGSVDLGLTGKDGVVHPSLEVGAVIETIQILHVFVESVVSCSLFLFKGKCKEV